MTTLLGHLLLEAGKMNTYSLIFSAWKSIALWTFFLTKQNYFFWKIDNVTILTSYIVKLIEISTYLCIFSARKLRTSFTISVIGQNYLFTKMDVVTIKSIFFEIDSEWVLIHLYFWYVNWWHLEHVFFTCQIDFFQNKISRLSFRGSFITKSTKISTYTAIYLVHKLITPLINF